MSKRILLGALIGAVLMAAAPAGSAEATYGDTRPCVTQREYDVIKARHGSGNNQSPAQVRNVFDSGGVILLDVTDDYDLGHYEEVWVDQGHWEYDPFTGGWMWYPMLVLEERWVADVVTDARDQFRHYRKCTRWGPGGSAAGIWFDDYRDDQAGLRSHKMVARNPAQLVDQFIAWAETIPRPS